MQIPQPPAFKPCKLAPWHQREVPPNPSVSHFQTHPNRARIPNPQASDFFQPVQNLFHRMSGRQQHSFNTSMNLLNKHCRRRPPPSPAQNVAKSTNIPFTTQFTFPEPSFDHCVCVCVCVFEKAVPPTPPPSPQLRLSRQGTCCHQSAFLQNPIAHAIKPGLLQRMSRQRTSLQNPCHRFQT